jgi:hypothetical protein
MPLRKPSAQGCHHFIPGQLSYLVGAGIHSPLAFKTDEATRILVRVSVLHLQSKKLFAWKVALADTTLAAHGNIKIYHSMPYSLHYKG